MTIALLAQGQKLLGTAQTKCAFVLRALPEKLALQTTQLTVAPYFSQTELTGAAATSVPQN